MCEAFEKAVAKYLNCNYVISVTNCTSALFLALKALDVGPGNEVICPDFTFPATPLAILASGATPVLVDVNMYSYNIDADKIERAITSRTKAIVPVHLFGRSAPMIKIMEIAKQYDLKVIEDAACALGASYEGRMLGTIGGIGCFSLHARKGITTGEGGLIATNSAVLANRMKRASNFGIERTFGRVGPVQFSQFGFNFKMSDIAAAIGLVQLSRIEKTIRARREQAVIWGKIIATDSFLSERITAPLWHAKEDILQAYVCRCAVGQRQAVVDYMREKGFETGVGTYACHTHPAFYMNRLLPNSAYLAENCISLPVWYGLDLQKEWDKGGEI
jgi:dTDP-4-amino-4,6-dideoxygalactose transaminase